MAEAIIKYSELIEDDGGFLKLEKDFEQLGKNLESQTKNWKNNLRIVDVRDTKEIEAYEKEVSKLKASVNNLKIQKQNLDLAKKKSAQLTKQEMIALEQERIAMNKNKAEAKAIAQIKSAQSGSIEQLRARLALITIAWSKLSEEERTNSKLGDRLVQSKKQITEELKREEKATGDARRNVGNYKESVKEAIQEMRLEKEALIQKRNALRADQNTLEESSAEYRIYQKEINKTEASINNLNNELNENVVVQTNMQQTTDKTAGLLTRMAVAVGGFQVFKSGVGLVAEFETQVADLSSVTGLSGKSLDDLKNKSIEFSKKFGISASSIAEGFKLAGSARPELLKNGEAMADLTEKAIILFKASGDDFPTSMKNLTGTLNAFDLPATKATEVMDTLANASQLGAQEIPYLTEAFTKFGGVASNAGVSVAESASALEILGKKIPEASIAGTNMKNILVKLQVEAAKQGRAFLGLGGELERLKPSLKDVTYLNKLFGVENIVAGQTLIQNADELKKMTTQLDKSGTAQEQMNIKSKTLAESGNRLRETFNSYFLELTNNSSVMEKFTGVINFLGENFSTIIGLLAKVVVGFIAYKTVVNSFRLAEKISETISYRKSIKELGEAQAVGTERAKSFSNSLKNIGSTLKSIGWTIVIGLVLELANAMYKMASGTYQAEENLRRLEQAKNRASKTVEKELERIKKINEASKLSNKELLKDKKITNDEFEKLNNEADLKSKEQLEKDAINVSKRLDIQKKYLSDAQKLVKRNAEIEKIAGSQGDVSKTLKLTNEFNKNKKQIEAIAKQSGVKGDVGLFGIQDVKGVDLVAQLSSNITELRLKYKDYHNELLNAKSTVLNNELSIEETTDKITDNTTEISKNNTTIKDNNTLVEARIKLMQDELELRNEIASIKSIAEEQKISKNIDAEIELRKKQAEEFGNVELTQLNDLINKESEIKKQASARDFDFKMKQLDENLAKEKVARLFDLDAQKIELEKGVENSKVSEKQKSIDKQKINESYNIALGKLNEEIILQENVLKIEKEKLTIEYGVIYNDIEDNRLLKTKETNQEILDSQKNNLDFIQRQKDADSEKSIIIFEDAINKQNDIIEKATGKQQKEEIQALKNLLDIKYELRKRAIENEYNYQISKVTAGSAEAIALEKEKQNELLKLNKDYNNEQANADQKLKAIKEQDWQNFVNVTKKTFEQILDKVEQNAQKEVQVSEEKIQKQNKQIDIQRDRAQKGLTNSLAFEEKELAKAELNKIKAEKKLAKIQKGKALYSAYSGYAGAGDKQALQHTLRDFAIMEAISLTFGDGGIVEDRLPSNGIFQGQSHKGNSKGIPILVEGSEGIFSGREMNNLGKSNFYALKEMAGRGVLKEGFFNGQRQTFIQEVNPIGFEKELIDEVKGLRRAFQEIEKSKYDVVGYTKDLFKVVETSTRGRNSIRTTHEIKRPKF